MIERSVLIERFIARVEPEPNSGCWLWVGRVDGAGYGAFSIGDGKQTGAHRFSYLVFVGAIPDGMLICHKCDQASCVNPDHLFVGSNRDNLIDCVNKGRHHHAMKSVCVHGHALSLARIRVRGGRKIRECRECNRLAAISYRRRRRQGVVAENFGAKP